MVSSVEHWERIYRERGPLAVSWHQVDPSRSLRLITAASPDRTAAIVDVGGGSSRLVDRLLDLGYTNLTVLDLAPVALEYARQRLGDAAAEVTWVEADVTTYRHAHPVDVWHDRAVFHFLTEPNDRARYVALAAAAVFPGGHLIVATFAPDGPTMCSGLPIVRYDSDAMCGEVAPWFEPVTFEEETHITPHGVEQRFLYGVFVRTSLRNG
jgi:SAM-dependent methyltransferase